MPPLEPFEAARLRVILRDLEKTTRMSGERCTLRLKRVTEGTNGIVIRGEAGRISFIRLCLLMADRALEDSSVTLIEDAYLYRVDMASEGRNLGVIEILLTDDPLIEERSAKTDFRAWGRVKSFVFGFLPLFLVAWIFVTGLVANLLALYGVSAALWEISRLSFGHP